MKLSRAEAQDVRLHLASWYPSANVSVLFDRGAYTVLVRTSPSKVHEVRSQSGADRLVKQLGKVTAFASNHEGATA